MAACRLMSLLARETRERVGRIGRGGRLRRQVAACGTHSG